MGTHLDVRLRKLKLGEALAVKLRSNLLLVLALGLLAPVAAVAGIAVCFLSFFKREH